MSIVSAAMITLENRLILVGQNTPFFAWLMVKINQMLFMRHPLFYGGS